MCERNKYIHANQLWEVSHHPKIMVLSDIHEQTNTRIIDHNLKQWAVYKDADTWVSMCVLYGDRHYVASSSWLLLAWEHPRFDNHLEHHIKYTCTGSKPLNISAKDRWPRESYIRATKPLAVTHRKQYLEIAPRWDPREWDNRGKVKKVSTPKPRHRELHANKKYKKHHKHQK